MDEGVVDVVAEIKGALGIVPASSDVPAPSPSLPTVEESEDESVPVGCTYEMVTEGTLAGG